MRRCTQCSGHFDLLSRQRTQNGMGPWHIRDQVNPFHPGCSYETLVRMVKRGRVRLDTVLRGPTTRQFWGFARHTPGVSHLLGVCHACNAQVQSHATECPTCHASFVVGGDRQHLGLAPKQFLPGDADPSVIAAAVFGGGDHPEQAEPSEHGQADHARRDQAPFQAQPATGPQFSPPEPETVHSPRRRRTTMMPAVVVSATALVAIALGVVVWLDRPAADQVSASEPALAGAPPAEQRNAAPEESTDSPASSPHGDDPDATESEISGTEPAPGPQPAPDPVADPDLEPAPTSIPASLPNSDLPPADRPDLSGGDAGPQSGSALWRRLAEGSGAEAIRESLGDPEIEENSRQRLTRRLIQLELLANWTAESPE